MSLLPQPTIADILSNVAQGHVPESRDILRRWLVLLCADIVGGGFGPTFGVGVETALGINIGSTGSPVLFDGALGAPSSGVLTHCTGLPAASVLPGILGAGAFTITGVVGSSPLTITGGTQVASFPILNLSQTWNNPAVTFTGRKTNITNTASAAASLVEDWKVDNTTVASLRVDGMFSANGFKPLFTQSQYDTHCAVAGTVTLASVTNIFWSTNTNPGSNSYDIGLARFLAGVLIVTDGGVGVGQIVTKLPTANPGPGILWNNTGIPAIGT